MSETTTSVNVAQRLTPMEAACLRRVRGLEEDGVIRGYHAQVAVPGEGGVKAFLELFYQNGRCQDYVERMREYPEIRHCSGISRAPAKSDAAPWRPRR